MTAAEDEVVELCRDLLRIDELVTYAHSRLSVDTLGASGIRSLSLSDRKSKSE